MPPWPRLVGATSPKGLRWMRGNVRAALSLFCFSLSRQWRQDTIKGFCKLFLFLVTNFILLTKSYPKAPHEKHLKSKAALKEVVQSVWNPRALFHPPCVHRARLETTANKKSQVQNDVYRRWRLYMYTHHAVPPATTHTLKTTPHHFPLGAYLCPSGKTHTNW